ncbi:TPA: hypothetical protein OGP63_004828 [Escherichia coli]|nr:hypothetical protein [Escherichia coli]
MYSPLLVHYSALQTQSALLAHLSQLEGELMRLRAWQRLGITPEPDDETEPSLVCVHLWDTGEALGREINHEIWTDSISTGKLTAGADACFARHDMM